MLDSQVVEYRFGIKKKATGSLGLSYSSTVAFSNHAWTYTTISRSFDKALP